MNQVVKHEDRTPEAGNVAGAESIMAVISRAASDPTMDVDKLERLMSLYERITAGQAEQAFASALAAAQAEIPQVLRDASNDHTKSRYARLETINAAVVPVVTRHGFSMSFGTEDSPQQGHYRVTCSLMHEGGHSRQYHADLPADVAGSQGKANKTAIQGFGSTVSYGRRYLTLLIFNVALTNEDDDAHAAGRGKVITEEQAAEIRDLIAETQGDTARFCRYFKIEAIPDLPADAYDRALAMLHAKRGAK